MPAKPFLKNIPFEDVLLLLLLLFAEDYLRSIFPENFFDMRLEEMSAASGWILVAAGITGMVPFFFRPNNEEYGIKGGSFSRGLSVFISFFGGFMLSFMVCGMIVLGFIKLGDFYFHSEMNDPKSWITVVLIILFLLFLFVFPFVLVARYADNYTKLKWMHPVIRFLLLLPAVFLATSGLNQHVNKDIISYSYGTSHGLGWSLFSTSYLYLICIVAPRLFASGEKLQWSGWLIWLVRFVLLFFGLYYDVKLF